MVHVPKTAGLALAAMLLAAASEAPPRIASIQPSIVQAGVPTEITVTGERLDAVTGVHLTGDGKVSFEILAAAKPDPKTLRVRASASAQAALGERELRLIAPGGVSNPASFVVGLLPILLEVEPNNRPDQAQKIAFPVQILGSIHGATEVDAFRFAAKKGEQLLFTAHALRIGSKLDPTLSILDASGRVVARDDDSYGLDPFLAFAVPEDGEYVVSLRDSLYRGGGEHAYQLDAGPFPLVESIFPLGGRRGTTVQIEVGGRNLQTHARHTLDLPADAPLGRREIRVDTPLGKSTSNPRLFEVGDLPEVVLPDAGAPPPVQAPIVVNGRIRTPGETDEIAFNTGEHAQLVCEIAANRYGSPLDALLTLVDPSGNVILHNDDAAGADARIDFNGFAKNSVYRLRVRDLVDRGGDAFAYRLKIAPPKAPKPDFLVKFIPDALAVSRGSHGKVWLEVTRQNGFAGDVSVSLAQLPQGVMIEPMAVPGKGPATALFAISAAPEAPLGSFPVTLVAAAGGDPKNALPELDGRIVRQAFLTVREAPPFTIDVIGPPSEDEQNKRAAELAELEKKLGEETPELAAALAAWEQSDAVKSRWVLLSPDKEVQAGTQRTTYVRKQPDGSFLVQGENPAKENYLFEARTSLKGITAFRLEALPDASLPAGGPGRAQNGNFVLSEFKVKAGPASGGPEQPVALHKTTVTFAQDGWPIAATIDASNDTGWAVSPKFGEAHTAVYETQAPLGFDGGTMITIALEHQSVHGQHTLGRFRIAVTTAKDPSKGTTLPANLEVVLDTAAEKRTPEQKRELAAYYRSIAPESQALRDRIARAKAAVTEYPPKAARNAATSLGVRVTRRPDFKGDVAVTVEGFTAGRDEKSKQAKPAAESLDVAALTIKDGQEIGLLSIKPKEKCDVGTRTIVLRGEAKVNNAPVVEYSRAIPMTVLEKAAAPAAKPAPKAAAPAAATKSGLAFAYYEGDWDALPDFDALTPVKMGNAAEFEIGQRNRDEMFGFRFTGFVNVPRDGEYTFATVSDDGSRLFIGTTQVVDNDGLHAPEEKSGKIALKAGKNPITVVFFEKGGGEHLEVFWEGPDLPKQKIAPAALFRAK